MIQRLTGWALWFISLPCAWIGLLLDMFAPKAAWRLLLIAYRLGDDATMGVIALSRISAATSPGDALQVARQLMQTRSDPNIAAVAGMLAIEVKDLDQAQIHWQASHDLGGDRNGLTEYLELLLGYHRMDQDACIEIAQRLFDQRDLSASVHRLVIVYMIYHHLLERDFDQVRQLADHLLAVQNDIVGLTAHWGLAIREQDQAKVDQLGSRLTKEKPQEYLPLQSTFYAVLGMRDQYELCMQELDVVSRPTAQTHRQFLEQRGVL